MELIRHIFAKLRGIRAHRGVDKTIGQFAKAAESLNTHAKHLIGEMLSNSQLQADLQTRNAQLESQRSRANAVKKELQKFVV